MGHLCRSDIRSPLVYLPGLGAFILEYRTAQLMRVALHTSILGSMLWSCGQWRPGRTQVVERWNFVQDKYGWWRWYHVAADGVVTKSAQTFPQHGFCVADAKKHGWKWPIPRGLPHSVRPPKQLTVMQHLTWPSNVERRYTDANAVLNYGTPSPIARNGHGGASTKGRCLPPGPRVLNA